MSESQPPIRVLIADGVAATRSIRECCSDVQVIALTSFVQDDLVHRAFDAGALSSLMKNVGPAELAVAIRDAARSHRRTLAPEASQALFILGKLGAATRTEAAALALKHKTALS
jgi:DNA-binding NarL/FixJ family response regulator